LGLKAPTPRPQQKDARFTFHTRRAVQSAIADLVVIFIGLLFLFREKTQNFATF